MAASGAQACMRARTDVCVCVCVWVCVLDVRSTGPLTLALGMVTPAQPFDLSPSGAKDYLEVIVQAFDLTSSVCVCVCMCVCVFVYMHACMRACVCVCVHAAYASILPYMHACMHACIHATCMHACNMRACM